MNVKQTKPNKETRRANRQFYVATDEQIRDLAAAGYRVHAGHRVRMFVS